MAATHPLTEAEILARLLYRDAMMLVIDKPPGITVHVTAHDQVALDQSFKHLQFGLPNPPALAHRLDRGTSGCLVLGRHRQALIKLGKLFEQQKIQKNYLAIVVGVPAAAEGVIDRPILKSGERSLWKMTLDDAGQPAVTHYKQLATNGVLSVLELSPKTGRTHQLRLHCAFALGCPVAGDPFYGVREGTFSAKHSPMMLHAAQIVIPLQPSKPPVNVQAPLPMPMAKLIATIGA